MLEVAGVTVTATLVETVMVIAAAADLVESATEVAVRVSELILRVILNSRGKGGGRASSRNAGRRR